MMSPRSSNIHPPGVLIEKMGQERRTLKFNGTMLRTRITRSMLDFSSSGGVTK
jgi:hypothetical protein